MKHLILLLCSFSFAQSPYAGYWQQEIDYVMDIRMDVETFRYSGTQQLTYTNHSPDTLSQVFYHLYFNAFQPGSDMDIRSRTIKDPDPRVGDRISKLNDDEIGFLHVSDLEQDGLARSILFNIKTCKQAIKNFERISSKNNQTQSLGHLVIGMGRA